MENISLTSDALLHHVKRAFIKLAFWSTKSHNFQQNRPKPEGWVEME